MLAAFFQIIRWKNLLMIALIQLLFKYVYFDTFNIDTTLDTIHFFILILATVCIAAAGYIINDVYDVETDKVNKPNKPIVAGKITKKQALNYYQILNLLGLISGLYLAYHVKNISFVAIFIFTILLLRVYSTTLKSKPIIGNLVVALLISLSILVVAIFDIIPAIDKENGIQQYLGFYSMLDYAVFAFMLNFLREIIKDIEDIDGDINLNMKTLPILIGRERSRNLVFGLSFIPLVVITTYTFNNFSKLVLVQTYMLVVVMLPFLYFMTRTLYAKNKKNYIFLSKLLKLIMLLGMLSIVVLAISINYAD